MTLAFIPIARPTFDVALAQQKTDAVRAGLLALGFDLLEPAGLVMNAEDVDAAIESILGAAVDLVILLQASFADSSMTVQIAESLDLPLLLWALPEERVGGRLRLNSFCGINLAAHGLTRAGYTYDYIYAEPDDAGALRKIQAVANAGAVRRRLKGARIGRVGENPAGFDTCRVSPNALKKQFGLEVVQLQLEAVFTAIREGDRAAVAPLRASLRNQVAGMDDMDATATDGTLQTYSVLQDWAENQHLDGYAVRCWPEFFTDVGCAACAAMSMLSDARVPSSCEADVNGTTTQLILQWLSDEPAFGSDIVSFDSEDDTAVLWHCGLAPLSMADPDVQPEATIHSNREVPLLMQFPLKPGRVTLARLSEATGAYRLVIGGGEMLKAPPAFTGTSGTIRFDRGAQAVMDTIMQEGLEHHLSLTYGDHIDALLALARMLNLPVLRL